MAGMAISCSESVPKPRGYFRIELPEKEYATYEQDNFPCRFEYAKNVSVVGVKGIEKDARLILNEKVSGYRDFGL